MCLSSALHCRVFASEAIKSYLFINTLRPRQNGCHFADDILMNMYEIRLLFHWNLFLRFELTVFQHWFRWWLGADQATSHYLNQWWLVYWRIVTRPQWVKVLLKNIYLASVLLPVGFQDRQISNISHTKSQTLNASRLVLHLSLPNLLKPCLKSKMKM